MSSSTFTLVLLLAWAGSACSVEAADPGQLADAAAATGPIAPGSDTAPDPTGLPDDDDLPGLSPTSSGVDAETPPATSEGGVAMTTVDAGARDVVPTDSGLAHVPDSALDAAPDASGSSAADDPPDAAAWDDLAFVPPDLPNMEESGAEGGLTLVAFTLLQQGSQTSLFAAVSNDGEVPACQAGMFIDFYDTADQLVTSAATGLLGGSPYQLEEDVILICIEPGQIAMAAIEDLPASIVVAELGHLVHRFPSFVVDATPLASGLSVQDLSPIDTQQGRSYAGSVHNGYESAVAEPSVAVFPLNRAGRPLAVARSSAVVEIPADDRWAFETSSVSAVGVDAAAYPSALILF